jgi:hypothetical protein
MYKEKNTQESLAGMCIQYTNDFMTVKEKVWPPGGKKPGLC